MSEREDLLSSIANTIRDYRASDPPIPTPDHVDHWVQQFDEAVQIPMLRELDHVLKRTYFSLKDVTGFLRKLIGDDFCAFWRGVHFLDTQGGGNSQTDMLALFDAILQDRCGYGVEDCGGDSAVYLYLDDGIFTGNRVRRDLERWIKEQAPVNATLHIVSIVLHRGGKYYAKGHITNTANSEKKAVSVKWWPAIEIEDRKKYSDAADVLRPIAIPDDPVVQDYVKTMLHKPTLRRPGNVGGENLFSSDEGKNLLEQEFLKAGARIRQLCPKLGDTQRPLGYMILDTLGFGSLIVTFRNCPNNAPLALWVGDPWYPLFPRTTNRQTEIMRMFADLIKDEEP